MMMMFVVEFFLFFDDERLRWFMFEFVSVFVEIVEIVFRRACGAVGFRE